MRYIGTKRLLLHISRLFFNKNSHLGLKEENIMGYLIYLVLASSIVIYICIVIMNILLAAAALVYCILAAAGVYGEWRERTFLILHTIVWPVLIADAIMLLSTVM